MPDDPRTTDIGWSWELATVAAVLAGAVAQIAAGGWWWAAGLPIGAAVYTLVEHATRR